MISIGEKMSEVISSVPLSLSVNLENAACHAVVGQSSRWEGYMHMYIYTSALSCFLSLSCHCFLTITHTHTHTHTHKHTHSVSLVLQTSHCLLKNKTLVADTYELGVVFDKHKIMTLENLKAVFPREKGAGEAERRRMKQIELETNPTM